MSTSMLEQAIIDAKALKESAIKNAEAMIIEKYSDQIKEAVDTLLEQEDEFGLESEEDPFATPSSDEATADPTSDPALNQVPTALEEDIPGADAPADDSGTVTIDLEGLLQQMEKYEEEEGVEPEASETHEELATSPEIEQAVDAAPEAGSTQADDVDLGIDDALVEEILERLKVDIDPQSSGWAGTPESQMEDLEDQALARENDDEVREENESLRARVEELSESLKNIKNSKEEALKLVEENDQLKEVLIELKEKIESVNVSNAKLLYINKALENSSLNERQKRKIVEAISKASTTKEAKVIYETLQSTVGSTEKRSMPKSLSEAVSRPSLLINSQRNREQKQADPLSERLQRLAGIKK